MKNLIKAKFKVLAFENDDEFTDFCLKPYAVVEEIGSVKYYTGVYSDDYLKCIAEGTHFVIKDEDSLVYKRQCVCKRVPLRLDDFPDYHREVLVQKSVENLDQYFDFPKR